MKLFFPAVSPVGMLKRIVLHKPFLLEQETIFFVVASALDAAMTLYLLNLQYIEFGEANPVARYFICGWGFKGLVLFKITLVAVVALICQCIARMKLDVAKRVMHFSTLLVSAVVLYSVLLLGRASGMI